MHRSRPACNCAELCYERAAQVAAVAVRTEFNEAAAAWVHVRDSHLNEEATYFKLRYALSTFHRGVAHNMTFLEAAVISRLCE